MNENEVRILGYCPICGEAVTDEDEDIYVNKEGHYFNSLDCMMEFYEVERVEV
jgi:hypothetical protein